MNCKASVEVFSGVYYKKTLKKIPKIRIPRKISSGKSFIKW